MTEPEIFIDPSRTRIDAADPDRILVTGWIDGIQQRTVTVRRGRPVYGEPEPRPVTAWLWKSAIDRPIVQHAGHAESGYLYPDSEVNPDHPDQQREVCHCEARMLTPEEQGAALKDALLAQNGHLLGTTLDIRVLA